MKRYTGIRVLSQALMDCDLGIYIGEGISGEAYKYRQHENNLYFNDDEEGLISFALGLAMGTDKRVFVFCEDQYFIQNMSEFMQAGVSGCTNLIIVLVINGAYTSVPATPLIFDEVNSQHGILYNMNLLVHDYSKFFKRYRNPIKYIREFWDRAKGPLVVLLNVEGTKKDIPEVKLSDSFYATKTFIRDVSIKAHNYVPPFSVEDLNIGG